MFRKTCRRRVQAAMDKLTGARNHLLHGGGEWGGFPEQAIENINPAIANLNKVIHYRA